MERLIDAHDLWSDIMMLPHNGDMISSEEVEQAIKEAPTVDAVEVVRCKDCKHGVWDEEEQLWECVVGADVDGDADTYALFHEYNEAEHFCSYGERRTDG